jgi:hypothetical protein
MNEIANAYLCESVLVQNSLLELRNFSRRYDSQRVGTGRSGRSLRDEGARKRDFGRRHLGLRSTPDTTPS